MTSHYKPFRNLRRGKRAKDEANIKAMGARTYGYDFANDGRRSVIDYSYIKNFLKGNVGRKWNDVYSDLCRKYDSRTYEGKLALEHAEFLVTSARRYGFCDGVSIDDNGVLQLKTKKRYRYNSKPKNIFRLTKLYNLDYVQVGGIWYEVILSREIPKFQFIYCDNEFKPMLQKLRRVIYDVFLGNLILKKGEMTSQVIADYDIQQKLLKYYGELAYAVSKKQVGKSICKKLNEKWRKK